MGKVFDSRTGRVRHRPFHRVSDRHAGPDTQFAISERRPIERLQRHRVEHFHGTGQRPKPDSAQLGLFGQSVGRRALQVFVPLRPSAPGTLFSGYDAHYRSAVEHRSAGSQQRQVKKIFFKNRVYALHADTLRHERVIAFTFSRFAH